MTDRLIREAARKAAARLVRVIEPCLREEERADAFAEFYRIVKAALKGYEARARRPGEPPGPS